MNISSKMKKSSERGSAGLIIVFLVGLGVAWFVIDVAIGWIYGKKEERIEETRRVTSKGRKKQIDYVTSTTQQRELGSYTVEIDK